MSTRKVFAVAAHLSQLRVDDAMGADAEAILKQSNRVDTMARREAYSEQGWTKFDHSADPYGPAEIERERDRYRVRTL